MIWFAVVLAAQAAAAQSTPAPAATAAPAPTFAHVVLVSFDGLRPDAIDPRPDGSTPALAHMLHGPGTLNARADPDITVTLPNHLDMFTGRMAGGADGHGWIVNEEPAAARHGGTLHKRAGRYIASMFDVAHDRGVRTGVFASKSKFWLLTQSYDDTEGAPDAVPPDNGRNKIDVFTYAEASADVATQAAAWLNAQTERSLTFIHFSDPDRAGHAKGWTLEPDKEYAAAVTHADAALGTFMTAINSSERLRERTVIILTADHGGGDPFRSHTEPLSAVNFRIPFLVWLGKDTPQLDLAALNAADRAQPAHDEYIPRDAPKQPIRSADAGNLALQLLGLPAIPGSTINAAQILHWSAPQGAQPAAPRNEPQDVKP